MQFTLLTVAFIVSCAILYSSALPAPSAKKLLDGNGLKDPFDSFKQADEKFSIANWNAPPEVASKFPYYLSGYDHEDRPIGVIEIGKWDAKAWATKGKEAWADLERHAEKMLYILKSGILAKNRTEDGVTKTITDEIGLIVDFDGFSVAQATNPKVVSFLTKYLGQLQTLQDRIGYAYFINVNAVASALVRILRPALGSAFERVEIFGTQTAKWMQVIRRNLPEDQIPEKYGGRAGHVPMAFYG